MEGVMLTSVFVAMMLVMVTPSAKGVTWDPLRQCVLERSNLVTLSHNIVGESIALKVKMEAVLNTLNRLHQEHLQALEEKTTLSKEYLVLLENHQTLQEQYGQLERHLELSILTSSRLNNEVKTLDNTQRKTQNQLNSVIKEREDLKITLNEERKRSVINMEGKDREIDALRSELNAQRKINQKFVDQVKSIKKKIENTEKMRTEETQRIVKQIRNNHLKIEEEKKVLMNELMQLRETHKETLRQTNTKEESYRSLILQDKLENENKVKEKDKVIEDLVVRLDKAIENLKTVTRKNAESEEEKEKMKLHYEMRLATCYHKQREMTDKQRKSLQDEHELNEMIEKEILKIEKIIEMGYDERENPLIKQEDSIYNEEEFNTRHEKGYDEDRMKEQIIVIQELRGGELEIEEDSIYM